jgi:hypothetical protein
LLLLPLLFTAVAAFHVEGEVRVKVQWIAAGLASWTGMQAGLAGKARQAPPIVLYKHFEER